MFFFETQCIYRRIYYFTPKIVNIYICANTFKHLTVVYTLTYAYYTLYFVVVQFVLVSRSTAHCGGIIRLNE